MKKFREQVLGTKKFFDLYCASYEFISIGAKRLMQHQIVKKGNISRRRKDFGIFFRIIEFKKVQRTIFEGPKSLLTITLEVKRSFLYHLRSC